jgi:dienelactone hydrolase
MHPGCRSGPGRGRIGRGRIAVLVAAGAVLCLSSCGPGDEHTDAAGRDRGSVVDPGSVSPATVAPATDPTGAGSVLETASTPAPDPSLPAPMFPPITMPSPPAVGPVLRDLPVATINLNLADPTRPVMSHGRRIADRRALTTIVHYPVSGGPFPLIVFAHGYQLGPSSYDRIATAIASAGYVVAAPSFPLADAEVAGPNLDRGDIPNQSGDLSFVITQLVNGSGAAAGLVASIDGRRIGAVGHSDGADTVLDLGYHPAHRDGRVLAVAALSPDAMTPPGGSVGNAPLLITHGDRDRIVAYSNSATVFGQVSAHRFLMTLIGADHLPPVTGAEPWTPVLDRVVFDLLDRYVAGRTPDDTALIADGAAPGVASLRRAG